MRHPKRESAILIPRALTLLICLCAAGVGCRPSVAQLDRVDREHRLMDRAMTAEQTGNLDEAIALYEKVLLEAPRTASAHLNLALLLHDYSKDYVSAIFHYRQYLKQREGTEKRAMLEDRLRLAEQLLAAQLARGRSLTPGLNSEDAVAEQIASLREQLADAEKRAGRLADENRALQSRFDELEQKERSVRRKLELLQSADLAGDAPPQRSASSSWTYIVVPGDSLRKIAQAVYGDERRFTLIRNANRGKIGRGDTLTPGQELTIPPLP